MPYGSLSKAYRTEIALGHLHANLVSLFKIRQRRLQKTKSMSGNINNRGKYTKKNQYTKTKNKTGMLQMECKWSRPTDWSSFISLSAKKKNQYYGIDLPKKTSFPRRETNACYDSKNSEMLKPLSFTRTICRGGGGSF